MAEETTGYVDLPNSWSDKSLNHQRRMYKELYDGVDSLEEGVEEAKEIAGQGLKEESVGTIELKDKAVTGEKLASKTVATDNLADKSVDKDKLLAPNKPNIVISKEPIDFDLNNSKIHIKSGGIRISNETFGFSEYLINYKEQANQGSVLNMVYDIDNKTFKVLTNPNFILNNINSTLVAVIDIINKTVSTSIYHTVNGKFTTQFNIEEKSINNKMLEDGSVNSKKVTAPNRPNIVINNEPFNFDLSNSKIYVKSGGIRISDEVIGFGDHIIDYKDKTNLSSVLNVIFNITNKKFEVLTNIEFSSNNAFYTLVGVIDVINRVISTSIKHIVNGQDFSKSVLGDFAIMGNLDEPVIFNLKSYQIKIPKTTNIWVNNKYFNSKQVTGGKDIDLVIPKTGSEMALIFDTEELVFKIVLTTEFNKISIYSVLIAFFSISFNKVFMIGNYVLVGSDENNESEISDYFLKEIERLNDDISQINIRDKFSFGFITDTHGHNKHIKNIVESSKNGQFDYLLHGGDFLYMETSKEKARKELNESQKVISGSKVPVLSIMGNHDNDNQVGNMSPIEVANKVIWSNKYIDYKFDNYKGYYVVDDQRRKVRVIMTNSNIEKIEVYNNWGWDKEQLLWLAEEALNVEEDWHVLVVGHHNARQEFSNVPKAKNGEEMLQILKAFKNGTSYVNDELGLNRKFENKGNLIGYLFGHTHCDTLTKQSDLDFYQISTASSKPDYFEPGTVPTANVSWKRPQGTKDEDCWDVFVIDTKTRNVKIRRFGAGENREFNY